MGKSKPFSHRPTLKQVNKKFKSKHATKTTLRDKAKGKISESLKMGAGKNGAIGKQARKNALNQLKKQKVSQLVTSNQLFNGKNGANKIIALVPLSQDASTIEVAKKLFQACQQSFPEQLDSCNVVLKSDILKQKFQFMLLQRKLYDILDACKVADFVMFVVSAVDEVDAFGELIIASIQSQGIPVSFNFAQRLDEVPLKKQVDIKKSLSSFMNYFFPDNDKILSIDNSQECLACLRSIAGQSPKPVAWREHHPYLLADKADYETNPSNPEMGTLKVTGYVRGGNLNANRLIHLQDLGDFQIEMIEQAAIPGLVYHEKSTGPAPNTILDTPNPELQDSLIGVNEPDSMDGEQTWPTEAELMEADERIREMGLDAPTEPGKGRTKRVVKGTSSYQAAWLVDSENEDDLDSNEENSDMSEGDEGSVTAQEGEEEEEFEDIEMEGQAGNDDGFEQLTEAEDLKQYESYLQARQVEFQGTKEFPDEVDTPLNLAARTRFQRYRGMLSLRTSHWDPYENLPVDYSRIYQIQTYLRTARKILANSGEGNVKMGTYVTIHIANVPRSVEDVYDRFRPFIAVGLLQHENKVTVVNHSVIRATEFKDPIKSKDPLIVQSGFRRYRVQPLFSQNAKKTKAANNVYKFERYLDHHNTFIMSFYGPISFTPAPTLVFRDTDPNHPDLVATGTFKDTDPTRIVAKRILLTGHPFKVNKKSAVVRFMFFNPIDIAWFKPIQLTTKFGRIGHIKDSVGTHGYMKCVFNNPIKQHDTVCLALYKRMFPKWNTQLFVRQ